MNLTEYRKGVDIEGALPKAIFNVSPTKKVVFSKGNLQFRECSGADTRNADGELCCGTWRFAEHQWDVIGDKNVHVGCQRLEWMLQRGEKPEDDNWIDLFGFGTSGWRGGTEARFPWATSIAIEWYVLASNGYSCGCTGDFANADWGWFNPISNGENVPNLWRTLTSEEWKYLFEHTQWTLANVENVLCLLLIPEKFIAPENISIVEFAFEKFEEDDGVCGYERINENECLCNDYNACQFKKLESLGIVALPCGGLRIGQAYTDVEGLYWSSSIGDGIPVAIFFNPWNVNLGMWSNYVGLSVRLVHDL